MSPQPSPGQPPSPEQPPALPSRAPRRPSTAQPSQAIPSTALTPPAPTEQRQPTPAAAPVTLTLPPPTATSTEPQTLRERLNAGDAHWQWKIGMRAVLVLVGLIGIGCAAWTVSHYSGGFTGGYRQYKYDLVDSYSMPWTLITFGLSVIWSAICIAVFFTRRPNRPVPPGAQVGVDLVIWLAFIPTALFAVLAVTSVMDFGSRGVIESNYSSSRDGYYSYVPDNNTWVWNVTQYSSYDSSYVDGSGRDCNSTSTSSSSIYANDYDFATCAEEDAFVNSLWQGKSNRFNTELTATVCQFLSLFLHFTLFIWACVDTNRRNSRNVSKEAETLAADIVMNMVKSGAIIPAPGAAQMRPMPLHMYPQQYNQQYPQQYLQPYSQQHPQRHAGTQPLAPPAPVASSSNEKGAGPRYA